MLNKVSLRCPITALAIAEYENISVVCWANGGVLHIQPLINGSTVCFSHQIFNTHPIRELRTSDTHGRMVAFGEKAFSVITLSNENHFAIESEISNLDDLILDVRIVNAMNHRNLIAIGYAHNFVDVMSVSSNNSVCLRRFCCPDTSALFSLSFSSMLVDSLLVASGTVFGKVIVWRVNVSIFTCDQADCSTAVLDVAEEPTVDCTAHKHEGVVFRIVWSQCGSRMLTVSDDRTVRLWSVGVEVSSTSNPSVSVTELLVGWGHISRVWDAAFLPVCRVGNEERWQFATCSEDSCVKIWDHAGLCVATLRGHASHVWRIVSAFDGKMLATCGNDASVKLWDVEFHRTSCPEAPAQHIRTLHFPDAVEALLPLAEKSIPQHQHNCRRANGVSFIKFSVCGSCAGVVLVDGAVWMVQVGAATQWHFVTNLGKPVAAADIQFRVMAIEDAAIGSSPASSFDLAAAHLDGTNSLLQVAGGVLQSHEWRAHQLRTVNVWLAGEFAVTATLKGVCTLWSRGAQSPVWVADCCTGSSEIATSVLCDTTDAVHGVKVVLGDSRGGVSAFVYCFSSSGDVVKALLVSSQFFPRVHGPNPVSCIAPCKGGFVTAGHDGFVTIFAYHPRSAGQQSSAKCCAMVNRMQTQPVTTPDQLFVTGEARSPSIFVCGYYGSLYIVWDVLRCYQVMRVEGGGWKRPHHCLLLLPGGQDHQRGNALPAVRFLCSAPVENGQTVLQLSLACPSLLAIRGVSFSSSGLPLQIRSSALGRVAYCSVLLQGSRRPEKDSAIDSSEFGHIMVDSCQFLVAGGEDGSVKVFECLTPEQQTPSLSLRQEMLLPGNASLKALATSSADASRGIVVGGGGKLAFSVWTYDLNKVVAPSGGNSDSGFQALPLGQVLCGGCDGKLWVRATQDHRILHVQCLFLGRDLDEEGVSQFRYLIVFCDSRGRITVGEFLHSTETSSSLKPSSVFSVLEEIQISECPVLCGSLVRLATGSSSGPVVGCFGDTSGSIFVWSLRSSTTHPSGLQMCSYTAHLMGSNCVSAALIGSSVEGVTTIGRLVVCSGGDDQSLSICRCSLRLEQDVLSGEVDSVASTPDASGSAIKGVALLSVGAQLFVANVGYDQRMSLWRVGAPGDDPDKRPLQWIAGEMVTVNDVCSLHVVKQYPSSCGGSTYSCVVAGEGVEVLTASMPESGSTLEHSTHIL